MSSASCFPPENCEYSRSTNLYLVAADEDMSNLLAGILEEQGIFFERRLNLYELRGPTEPHRTVALLRHVLSAPERQAVSVLSTDSALPFPTPRNLDHWWRIHQTGWFADALANHRFETWFQPIVDTSRHRIVGHECLVRLNSGRIYNGAEIVEAAETHSEIHAFDSCARSLAIRSAAHQAQGPPGVHPESLPGLYFVNFIPASIYNPEHCMKSTLATVAESGMNPEDIVFEVVEADRVLDISHLLRIRDYCERNGFGFALDNVGTGTTSLQTVSDLHPDYIKLDRSLIMNIEQPRYATTVRKLSEVAGRLGAGVIAAGVEKTETMENLWLLGIQWMQGYLFGHPSPRLARQKPNPAWSEQSGGGSNHWRMLNPDLVNLSLALAEECRTGLGRQNPDLLAQPKDHAEPPAPGAAHNPAPR